jgi:uncharacterized membrane protein
VQIVHDGDVVVFHALLSCVLIDLPLIQGVLILAACVRDEYGLFPYAVWSSCMIISMLCRSMGGGGYSAGRLGGSSFGPSMRAPSLNRSYEPSYSNRGVGAPVFGFGYSPFGFGYGAPVVVSGGGGGGSAIFGLLVVGLFTYLAFNAITSSR